MYSIRETRDVFFIRELLSIDDVYASMVYDHSSPWEDYIPDMENSLWIVLYKGNEPAGIVRMQYMNCVLWMPHIAIFKQFRGEGLQWGHIVSERMRDAYGAKKLLAITPYEAARKYAERVGFKEIGVLKESARKNGKLLDQYILEKKL